MKFFEFLAPYLAGAGTALVNADIDETGADDFAGNLLVWGAEVIAAVITDEDLPPFPEALLDEDGEPVFFGSLSPAGRTTIAVVSSVLSVGYIQLMISGKSNAARTFKYINQALNALVSGKAVPAPSF